MTELLDQVRDEIEYLHRFFVAWFSGAANQDEIEAVIVPRFADTMVFIGPSGTRLGRDGLLAMFRGAHGSNPKLRIAIREVAISHQTDDLVIATYTEWQRGARASKPAGNARLTTAVLERGQPWRWLHVHETWLPDDVRARGSFEF